MMKPPWTPQEIRRFYIQRIPKLNLKGKEWRGPCPVHNGKRDSFAVNPLTGQAFCHSECGRGWSMVDLQAHLADIDTTQAAKEIAALVGRTLNGNGDKKSHSRIVATYEYVDEKGHLLFEVVRLAPKDFRQRRIVAGKPVWNIDGVRRVLFRLPQVIAADEIVVVEGEKDVCTLEHLGFIATTCPMGAGKWHDSYSQFLAGKSVIIIPDNDEKGKRHATDVQRSLQPVVRELIVVRLPDKDVTAWFENGGTAESLKSLIHEARTTVKPVSLPTRFKVTQEGVFYVDPDPQRLPVWICGNLRLLAETRGRDNRGWGVLVEWTDRGGSIHRWAIPHGSMKGDAVEVLSTLADGGLRISTGSRERKLLVEYLNQQCSKLLFSSQKVGWSGVSFVLPDRTIGPESADEVIFQGDLDGYQNFRVSGTVEDWREKVSKYCAGNSRLQFAVSAAFAGPLLTLCNFDGGGFHFVGETSCGKSTALIVGGSVIGGGGRQGFTQSWRTTDNGLEAVAEQHNDLTLFLDELAEVDPKRAAEVAYLLGNGAGKGRMSKTISARRKLSWTLLYVSAGEVTLREHAGSVGKLTKGGVEVRLLNIKADAGKGLGAFEDIHNSESPAAFSNMLRSAAKKVFGAPLRSYLQHVVEHQAELEQSCRKEVRRFAESHVPMNAANEVGRAAARFGVVAVAGELATRLGLTGWRQGDAENAAAACFSSWITERGSIRSSDDDQAVRTVRYYLERFGNLRFHDMKVAGPTERAGFRRPADEKEQEAFLILKEPFRLDICAGFDYSRVAKTLHERGHLKKDHEKWTTKVRIPAMGRGTVDVFWVRTSIFEEE